MKAVKLHAKNDLRIDKIEKSAPKAGEILIKIGTAGVCHSDLHDAPVFTLGHDNASWIKELGKGVTDFKVEEAVIVYAVWGCGHWLLVSNLRKIIANFRSNHQFLVAAWLNT